jgi:hypothetical protein
LQDARSLEEIMAGTGSTVFKYGCMGCLGFLGLLLVVAVLVTGVAWMQADDLDMAEDHIDPVLPTSSIAIPMPPVRTPVEEADGFSIPAHLAELQETEPVGIIILRLEGSEFEVEPAPAGESLSIDASYDRNSYELEQSLTESEDGPWEYRISFKKTGGWFTGLKEMFSGQSPRVRIYLPSDIPVALDLQAHKGGAEIELGGMWITEADVNLGMGGMVLSVSEPLKAPMQRMDASASMGGFVFRSLGNASPRELNLEMSMGGGDVDLRGQWVNDADVNIRFSMGGCSVRLPKDVVLEGLDRTGMSVGNDQEIQPPTLSFTIEGDVDSINFQ